MISQTSTSKPCVIIIRCLRILSKVFCCTPRTKFNSQTTYLIPLSKDSTPFKTQETKWRMKLWWIWKCSNWLEVVIQVSLQMKVTAHNFGAWKTFWTKPKHSSVIRSSRLCIVIIMMNYISMYILRSRNLPIYHFLVSAIQTSKSVTKWNLCCKSSMYRIRCFTMKWKQNNLSSH